MKTLASVALGWLFVIVIVNVDFAADPTGSGEARKPVEEVSYTVACTLVDRTKDGGKPEVTTLPKTTVVAGKSVRVLDRVTPQYSIQTSKGDKDNPPIKTEFVEGSTLDFSINTGGGWTIVVDVTFDELTVEMGKPSPNKPFGHGPRQRSTKQRVMEATVLGQKDVIALDGKSLDDSRRILEFVVTKAKP